MRLRHVFLAALLTPNFAHADAPAPKLPRPLVDTKFYPLSSATVNHSIARHDSMKPMPVLPADHKPVVRRIPVSPKKQTAKQEPLPDALRSVHILAIFEPDTPQQD